MKVLALDYGSARTGVAVSDPTGAIARPLGVVERVGTEGGMERLLELVRDQGAERVVVGMPLTLRGERGGRTCGGAPAGELPDMAEQPRRLSLPAGYRPPQHGPTRRQRRTRRLVVFALLLLFLALLYGAVKLALGGSGGKAQPTTSSAAAPRPFKVIFPEGFTRRQMAGRVAAVDRIAYRERHLRPRLSPSGYLRLTRRSALPGRFAGDHKARQLEGFLFPATYDFLASTTTRQLVNQQLVAFDKAWARLNLRYARSRNLTSYDVLIIASMIEKEAAAPEERPLIAAVIYNRLHLHMALGIDATIRYGL
ncbi:MAG: endolytic transglycosylase MltG, partial [Gaiellaceae bacterium]